MKKLLALVLALVMSMSLVTISNADFNDADEINFSEAVEVMNAVGVLAGYDNGDFGPADTLTRAQACKILAYLDLGKDVAEALPGIQVFSDVPADNWAAKYIAYCADAGYVSGIGDGKFAPNEKVTGYQFGKMLLCVLGYDATIESMTGANWQIAVAKLMEENDIADGVSGYASANLTREQASQYALNALKATCVEYEDKGTVIEGNGLTITTGAKKAEEVIKNHDDEGDCAYCSIDDAQYSSTKDYVQLGEKLYKGDLVLNDSDEIDEYGRPSIVWEYKDKDIGTYAKTAAKTYVGELKANTLLKDFDLDDGYVGAIYVVTDDADPDSFVIADKYDGSGITDNGTVTEVFTTDGDITAIINIPYYVGEVTNVEEADEDDEDSKRTITISFGDTSYDYETESFEEDDIVMFTLGYDADDDLNGGIVVMSAELAKSVSGKITAVKSGKYTISGTTYKTSGLGVEGDTLNADCLGDEGTFYLTVDGTIGYYTEKSSSTGNYAYIYNITVDEDSRDEDGNTDDIYTAYYVDAAGVKAKAELYVSDEDQILGQAIPDGETPDFSDLFGIYEYDLTKDGMKAVENEQLSASEDDDLADLVFGSYYANAKTTFVFVYDDDGKITSKVVTGIKNVAKYAEGEDADVLFAYDDDNYITYAFVVGEPADADSDYLYAVLFDGTPTVTKNDDDDNVYTYEVYVDGKKTTLTFEDVLDEDTFTDGAAFAYKMGTTYAKDAALMSELDDGISNKTVDKVVGDDVVIDGDVYTIADDAVVYVVKTLNNGDLKVTLGSVKAGNTVYAFYDDDDEVLTFVVVDKREED